MKHARSSSLRSVSLRDGGWFGASLGAVWKRSLLLFGFLVPLTITVYGQTDSLASGIPAAIPTTAVLTLLALVRGGFRRVVSAWRASPAVFWLYTVVCAVRLSNVVPRET